MKNFLTATSFSVASLLLVACANEPQHLAPAINQSPASSVQPAQASLVPVEPATNPRMKITRIDLKPAKILQGQAAVDAANKSAQQQPNSSEYINAIMSFDYQPGALYQIYSAPLSITDVQFEPGEKIVSVAAGDTLRWQLSKTYSGSGSDKVEHIVMKPVAAGLTNGLVVTTDRRTYHMALQSTPQTYMASVKWRYPGDGGLVQDFNQDLSGGASAVDLSIDVAHIDTAYTLKLTQGDKPIWYPKSVFNDGKKTYIQFPGTMQQAPTLFVGTDADAQMVNYRVVGNYYVVDQVINTAQLRSGQDRPTIVQISYNN